MGDIEQAGAGSEVAGQRIDIVAVTILVTHRVVKVEQGDPLLKVRHHHLGWCWGGNLSVHSVTIGEGGSLCGDHLHARRVAWGEPQF